MKKKAVFLAGVLLTLLCGKANAEQWQIVGPRALGMGGAHVAVVNDATASYWNPATFGFFGRTRADKSEDEHFNRDWGLHIQAGAGAQLHDDIAEEVNDVLDYDYDTLSARAQAGTVGLADLDDYIKMMAEVRDLDKREMGMNAIANVGISTRFKNFGIATYGLGEISADPTIDTTNLGVSGGVSTLAGLGGTQQNILTSAQRTDLINSISGMTGWTSGQATSYVNSIDQSLFDAGVGAGTVTAQQIEAAKDIARAAAGGSLSDNNTNVRFRGAAVVEVPITYGHAFNDNFSIGGNIKFMQARVYNKTIRVFDKKKDDFFKNAFDDYTKSSSFGIDLGVLGKIGDFRLGLVGRNLNNPEFDDNMSTSDYQVDSQVRAGVAYIPAGWLTLAVDADVFKNNTPFAYYDSQNIAGGIELRAFNFLSLRGGAYQNIADSDSDLVYTAGLGVNVLGFNLDAGIAVSSENTSLDDTTIPKEARAEMAVSFQY